MTVEITEEIVCHIPALRRYALFLCRDPQEADDVVQGCLLRALDNLDRFTPGSELRGWLLTILRNLFLTDVRKRRQAELSVLDHGNPQHLQPVPSPQDD